MKSYDFEYDGHSLHEFGMIICKFGSNGGVETVSNGSNITFNTVSTMGGAKHELTSVEYSECLTSTFQICKHPCMIVYDYDAICDTLYDREEISLSELREIMKWLNRKEFHKFKLLNNEEYINIYFEASFNVSKIEINGKIYGLQLEMNTNRPFAIHEDVQFTIKNLIENGKSQIDSKSDEEGYIYPEMEITINEDGDLDIFNDLEERIMHISNCKNGEVIKVSYPIIESSLSSHKIQNDFNWVFFRIANTFKNKINNITISIPCTIKIKYNPIVKVGI